MIQVRLDQKSFITSNIKKSMDKSGLNGLYKVNLNLSQMDLISSLLLDQLLGLNVTEEVLNNLSTSYADFIYALREGLPVSESKFAAGVKSIEEIVKADPHYLSIVKTLLSLWKISSS